MDASRADSTPPSTPPDTLPAAASPEWGCQPGASAPQPLDWHHPTRIPAEAWVPQRCVDYWQRSKLAKTEGATLGRILSARAPSASRPTPRLALPVSLRRRSPGLLPPRPLAQNRGSLQRPLPSSRHLVAHRPPAGCASDEPRPRRPPSLRRPPQQHRPEAGAYRPSDSRTIVAPYPGQAACGSRRRRRSLGAAAFSAQPSRRGCRSPPGASREAAQPACLRPGTGPRLRGPLRERDP
eukprot:scaffold128_cov248-Pinguiococcus_pyrenoidosus.AAC.8